MDNLVTTWTGWHANALREALRMTNEEFAEHLNVAVRTVVNWRTKPGIVPRQSMQQILDTALERAPELARAHFRRLVAERDRGHARTVVEAGVSEDPGSLTEWLTVSGTTDGEIERIARATTVLAEAHPLTPAAELLTYVSELQAEIQQKLIHGGLRHRHERELLRLNGEVLAHTSLLLSDLRDSQEAESYGNAALLYLREAGASEATAWYVLAKNARWCHQYALAGEMAGRGLQHCPSGPMAVQLTWYQANAYALAGDIGRARAAMRRAEQRTNLQPLIEVTPSPWSFPEDRITIFRLSVALHTGDPDGALLAASDISSAWDPGSQLVPAAWAQIRIGAGIAYLLKDEPDGAAEQVRPVLNLPPGLRIATVTGWLADLDQQLADTRYAHVPIAAELRQQINDFAGTARDAQKPSDAKRTEA